MTNPIGAKEQREELRATPPYELGNGEDEIYTNLIAALDGLDIAEKMARAALIMDTTITTKRLGEIYASPRALWFWYKAASERMVELLRDWQAWKEGASHD